MKSFNLLLGFAALFPVSVPGVLSIPREQFTYSIKREPRQLTLRYFRHLPPSTIRIRWDLEDVEEKLTEQKLFIESQDEKAREAAGLQFMSIPISGKEIPAILRRPKNSPLASISLFYVEDKIIVDFLGPEKDVFVFIENQAERMKILRKGKRQRNGR